VHAVVFGLKPSIVQLGGAGVHLVEAFTHVRPLAQCPDSWTGEGINTKTASCCEGAFLSLI
jgi:hypothetical protein